MVHIKGRDSNLRLQRSIHKDGLSIFKVFIYYYHNNPAVYLTDIEKTVISAFPFSFIYIFVSVCGSYMIQSEYVLAVSAMNAI